MKPIGHAIVLTSTDNWTHDQYSDYRNSLTRRGYIGGSLAGAVLGVNPFCSKMKAWLMLAGMYHFEQEESERMWCGRFLEPAVRIMFEQRTRRRTRTVNAILQHPKYPWMICTLDSVVMPSDVTQGGPVDAREGVHEIKTTGAYLAKSWDDGEIADAAFSQCLHNMAVTGLRYGYVSVLIGGNRLENRRVDWDDQLIEMIIDREYQFHKSVQNMEPPEWEGDDADLVNEMFPPDLSRPEIIELPEEALALVEQYEHGKAAESEGKKVKEEASTRLKAMMGKSQLATVGGYPLSWKPVERKAYTVEAKTIRQFRIGKRREA